MTRDKWQGHIAILAANLIFGFNIPLAKTMVPVWIGPYALTFLRMACASLLFWGVGCWGKCERVERRDLTVIFLGALFGLVGAQLSFANSLRFTSPVNISIIAAMTPVAVILLAALILRELITWRKAAGVLVGALGALLIILQSDAVHAGGSNHLLGNMLCVVNVISYAIYLVIIRPVSQRYHAVTLMKWMFLFSALISLPFGIGDLPHSRVFSGETDWEVMLRLGYVVFMATGVAYFLIPLALKHIRSTTVSMYNNIQPVVASVLAIAVGQDVWSWDKPVAALLVFAGVYLVTQTKSGD